MARAQRAPGRGSGAGRDDALERIEPRRVVRVGGILVGIVAVAVDRLGQCIAPLDGADAEQGSCLACICRPKGKLVIDA